MVCIVSREERIGEESRAVGSEGVQTVDTGRASRHAKEARNL